MTYFLVLPSDLTLELSLYLNYRDSCLACEFLKCERIEFWLNKIRRELRFSNEFIQQYIYDGKTVKTLLPINEKYLELKARTTADFGTEFYQSITILIKFSSLIRDFALAKQLVQYFLTILGYDEGSNEFQKDFRQSVQYKNILRNSMAVNNVKLASAIAFKVTQLSPAIHMKYKNNIVQGIYENNPIQDQSLFKKFKIKASDFKPIDIVFGLANGGHLKEMLEKQPPASIQYNLSVAIERGRKNIIDHFNLLSIGDNLRILIDYGHVDLLPDLEALSDNQRLIIMVQLIRRGYLELVQKNIKYLTDASIINLSIKTCIHSNHLDMLNYLYEFYQIETMSAIRQQINLNVFKFEHLTVDMLEYLTEHKLINFNDVQLGRLSEKLDIMNSYNPEGAAYLTSLTRYRYMS